MGSKRKSKVVNTFENGMFLDSLPSLQPPGTYREAWGVRNKTDKENKFGVSNVAANEIHVKLPNGIIRSLLYIEERDYFIAFMKINSGGSEIGIINEKLKQYTKVVDDGDLPEPLSFSDQEWNSMTAKVMQPCNQLHIYWSNADYFYRINLEDPCRDWKKRPIKLFREHCVSAIVSTIMEGGSLPNGIYHPFVRLRDADGNTTNWFRLGQPIQIGQGNDGDNIPGEDSEKSIQIKIENLHEDYGIVDIGIHSVVGGQNATVWIDTVAYGKGIIDYQYRGKTGKEIPISISDVLGRNDLYIRGKNLTQFDGHLVLYNLRANNNIDWQRDVNNFKLFYQIYAVPIKEAYKYKGLRPNENYWFGIHENYVDGTTSTDFKFIGKDGSNAPMVRLPGCDCEVPNWEVEDTSIRTKTFCDLSGLIRKNQRTHILKETGANPIIPDYTSDGKGGAVVENNNENVNQGKLEEELNTDFNEAVANGGKSFDHVHCMGEKMKEVLLDATVLPQSDPDRSIRFAGAARGELFDLACICENLRYPPKDEKDKGNLVYPPGFFHQLLDDAVAIGP